VRAGELRHRLIVTPQTHSADGRGGFTVADGATFPIFAKVEAPKGMERVEAAKRSGFRSYKIVTYYNSSISVDDKLTFAPDGTNRTLRVAAVNDPPGRRRYMEIDAEEKID